jgi:hypothetical protein
MRVGYVMVNTVGQNLDVQMCGRVMTKELGVKTVEVPCNPHYK